MNIRKLIFDCDGVLFDSNELKNVAFSRTLAPYGPRIVEAFLEHHRQHGGVSRYIKFRRLFTEILQQPEDEQAIHHLLTEFSKHCRQLYKSCSMTPSARETVRRLSNQHQLYVASGGDQEELRAALSYHGVAHYFADVLGSPTPKDELIAQVLERHPKDASAVMVGDAVKDFTAAKKNGVPCVIMPTYSDAARDVTKLAEREHAPLITHLAELESILAEL